MQDTAPLQSQRIEAPKTFTRPGVPSPACPTSLHQTRQPDSGQWCHSMRFFPRSKKGHTVSRHKIWILIPCSFTPHRGPQVLLDDVSFPLMGSCLCGVPFPHMLSSVAWCPHCTPLPNNLLHLSLISQI